MTPTTCLLILSKFGDICGILPIAKHLSDSGNKPAMVVNMNFASILRGVSYALPDIVHFPMSRLDLGREYAKNKYATVLECQPYGKGYKGRRDVPYNLLAWQCAGFGQHFDDTKNFPLIFDRRDKERESFLVTTHRRGDKPLVLISVGCSRSSPFATHHAFSEAIKRKHGHYCEILDLCNVKAARLYDLLGLFDVASLLITGDTSALHLAAASPAMKTIVLNNDNPFLASRPRCNVVYRTTYNQVADKMAEIHAAVRRAVHEGSASMVSSGGTSPASVAA